MDIVPILLTDVPLSEISDKYNNRSLSFNQVVTQKNLLLFYCVTLQHTCPTYEGRDA